jgi:hypothetical protein
MQVDGDLAHALSRNAHTYARSAAHHWQHRLRDGRESPRRVPRPAHNTIAFIVVCEYDSSCTIVTWNGECQLLVRPSIHFAAAARVAHGVRRSSGPLA